MYKVTKGHSTRKYVWSEMLLKKHLIHFDMLLSARPYVQIWKCQKIRQKKVWKRFAFVKSINFGADIFFHCVLEITLAAFLLTTWRKKTTHKNDHKISTYLMDCRTKLWTLKLCRFQHILIFHKLCIRASVHTTLNFHFPDDECNAKHQCNSDKMGRKKFHPRPLFVSVAD